MSVVLEVVKPYLLPILLMICTIIFMARREWLYFPMPKTRALDVSSLRNSQENANPSLYSEYINPTSHHSGNIVIHILKHTLTDKDVKLTPAVRKLPYPNYPAPIEQIPQRGSYG